ncbi:MAG: hypothetical protein KDA55_20420 [Planctomycetales bacterium]|nr:hypothetical protein [Planctomycetales bacterium]
MKWLTPANIGWLIGYGVTIAALLYALYSMRPGLIESFESAGAQEQWQAFVDDAKRQAAGEGPVTRRVPRSAEPPTLVLLRDYFSTCVAGAVIFGSALYFSTMFFVRGIFSARRPRPHVASDDD